MLSIERLFASLFYIKYIQCNQHFIVKLHCKYLRHNFTKFQRYLPPTWTKISAKFQFI